MRPNHIKDPIALRVLAFGDKTIEVRIDKPVPYEDGNDFLCAYAIKIGEQQTISAASGMDAVQALQLAMKKIAVDLRYMSETSGVPISWIPDTPGDTGFP